MICILQKMIYIFAKNVHFLHIFLHIYFTNFSLSVAGTCVCNTLIISIFHPYFTTLLYLQNGFLTLNFGQLLYLLDDELKNTIRNFEKQKKQIISAQYGKLFNQTYIYVYKYKFIVFTVHSCLSIKYSKMLNNARFINYSLHEIQLIKNANYFVLYCII